MSTITRTLTERELFDPTVSERPWTAYWVDLFDGKKWNSWFMYSSLKAAREVRGHFKGIQRLNDYYMWPSFPVKDARVRTVKVTVEVET